MPKYCGYEYFRKNEEKGEEKKEISNVCNHNQKNIIQRAHSEIVISNTHNILK